MKSPSVFVRAFLLVCLLAFGMLSSGPLLADPAQGTQVAQSTGGDAATPAPKPGNCSASSPDGKQACQTNCKAGQVAHCTDGDPPTCVCSGG
jgi:hypothetical protein